MLHLQAQKAAGDQEIVNVTGQVMLKIPAGTAQEDILHFTPDIYLLRPQVGAQYQVQKILKQ